MVVRQPSKLVTWVRFPSPAPLSCLKTSWTVFQRCPPNSSSDDVHKSYEGLARLPIRTVPADVDLVQAGHQAASRDQDLVNGAKCPLCPEITHHPPLHSFVRP